MDDLFLGPNPNYPQISAAVSIEYDEGRGRYIKALQEIPSGSVILINRCRSIVVMKRHLHCRRCGKFLTENFISCPKCDECRYCSARCQKEGRVLHAVECGLYKKISELGFCELAMQVVLQLDPRMVKKYFSNDFLNFDRSNTKIGFHEDDLEAILSLECAKECPASDKDINKMLDLIMPRLSNLSFWTNSISPEDIRPLYFRALKSILYRIPHNAYALVPEENRCENLLRPHSPYFPGWMLHEQILYAVGGIQESDRPGRSIIDISDEERSGSIIGGALFTIAAIANHSCDANMSHELVEGNIMVFRTNKDVERGEELCDNYGPRFGVDIIADRQKSLQERYGFTCKCEACSNKNSRIDSILNGILCVQCKEIVRITNQEPIEEIECSNSQEIQPVTTNSILCKLQPDYWSDSELDEFFQFYENGKKAFTVGNLRFEQLIHLLAYNCVLELQFEKAENCLDYIKQSVEKRLSQSSMEYVNVILAYASLYYVWNLWLQQDENISEKYFDQVEACLLLSEKLYHSHVSSNSYRHELIKWLRDKNQELKN